MHDASLSPAEQADLRQYRDVSRLAILALVAGVIAPVALAHPLLWFIPIAGAVLGAGAIFVIRGNPEVTGRRMAVAGLVLSLFFGSWSIGQVTLRGWILQSQAKALADHYLTLWKTGKFEQAHQLSLPAAERLPEGTDLPAIYESSSTIAETLQSQYAMPPRSWLKQMHDGKGDFRFIAAEFHSQESATDDLLVLLYEITVPAKSGTDEYRVRVHVARKVYDALNMVDWYVLDCTNPDAEKF